jgi:tryptophan synthase alpha chain
MTTPNRIAVAMQRAANQQRAALIAYVTCGDPSLSATVEIVLAAASAGVDIVELGVPFSDPSADGPSIQRAMERAVAAGAGLPSSLEVVAQLRARGCEVPIVLFGYYNPIVIYGVEQFAQHAARCGVDGVLTVDLPVNELAELATPLAAHGIAVIPLLAPTSTPPRYIKAASFKPPFIYYISMTGVTGGAVDDKQLAERVANTTAIRAATHVPVAVGFGIRTAADAAAVANYADGVVVGSAIVDIIAAADVAVVAQRVGEFLGTLRQAMNR